MNVLLTLIVVALGYLSVIVTVVGSDIYETRKEVRKIRKMMEGKVIDIE